jgi:hypothetical protein
LSRAPTTTTYTRGVPVEQVFEGDPELIGVARRLRVYRMPLRREKRLMGTAAVLRRRFSFLSDDEACLLARHWAAALLAEYEVKAWLEVGLGPRDHQLAEALRANGVCPDHLVLKINDVHVARLLRDSRSVETVTELLRRTGRI